MSETHSERSRNTVVFAAGTMLSRVLGLLRDLVWVIYIPAASRDAFLVAFRFPNMLRDLVGEGAANAAFVPVFSEHREMRSDPEYRELISAAMSAMIVVLGVLTVAGLLILPHLLGLLDDLEPITKSATVDDQRIAQMIQISLWTFPYLFLIGLTVFCMGPLFTAGRYGVPSWTPALLNVGIIGACIALHDRFADPAFAPVVGVWIGGTAQLVVQYIAMGRATGVWLPNFKLRHPALMTIFGLMIPVIFGQAAGELNKLVDLLFAASLPLGTVTVLFYANRLVQLPLSIFGIATSVAILPSLSRAAARDDKEGLRIQLMAGLRQCLFLVLPASVGLIVLSDDIIRMLFEYGHFTSQDTANTAAALRIYALGLCAFALVKVAVSGFYAVQNTRMPVIIASGSMLLNILLNAVLVGPLGFQGLALATTLSFAVNFLLLYLFLSDRFGLLWDRDFGVALFRMAIAVGMMMACVYGVRVNLADSADLSMVAGRALVTVPSILTGAAVYALLCIGMGVREATDFRDALRRRLS